LSDKKKNIKVGQNWIVYNRPGEGDDDLYFTFQIIARITFKNKVYFVGMKHNIPPAGLQCSVWDITGKNTDDDFCMYGDLERESKSIKSLIPKEKKRGD
jgi:hypothetical protein